MPKRLALTTDGRMTYCFADDKNIGRGRCNHIGHMKDGESQEHFSKRMQSEEILQESIKDFKFKEGEEVPKEVEEIISNNLLENMAFERLRQLEDNSDLAKAEILRRTEFNNTKDPQTLQNIYFLVSEGEFNKELDIETPKASKFNESDLDSSDKNTRLKAAMKFLGNESAGRDPEEDMDESDIVAFRDTRIYQNQISRAEDIVAEHLKDFTSDKEGQGETYNFVGELEDKVWIVQNGILSKFPTEKLEAMNSIIADAELIKRGYSPKNPDDPYIKELVEHYEETGYDDDIDYENIEAGVFYHEGKYDRSWYDDMFKSDNPKERLEAALALLDMDRHIDQKILMEEDPLYETRFYT